MIFYSWTALSESDLVALSGSDLVALSESDLVALSESDLVALSESGLVALSDWAAGTARVTATRGRPDRRSLWASPMIAAGP